MRSIEPARLAPTLYVAQLARMAGELAMIVRLRLAALRAEPAHAAGPASHVEELLDPVHEALPRALLRAAVAPAAPAQRRAAHAPAVRDRATDATYDDATQPDTAAPISFLKGFDYDPGDYPQAAPVSAAAAAAAAQLGHRLRPSGSLLYAQICMICAATDADGDRRLKSGCRGSAAMPPSPGENANVI